jgi:pentalenene oxygenase
MSIAAGVAPGALPVLGHALHLRLRPLSFMRSLADHGDLVQIRVGRRRAYVPTHPEVAWQVLMDSATFDKGGPVFEKARYVLGNGLASCPHAEHGRQRKLVQPSFHKSRLPRYGEVMAEVVAELTSGWRDGQVIDVTAEMMSLTARIATRTLADKPLSADSAKDLVDMYATITHGVYKRITAPLGVIEHLPTRSNRRYASARDRLRRMVGETVEEYRTSGADRGDIMSSLVRARDPDGNPMSDTELHEQMTILLTGEVETTGAALAWTFHLLAGHPTHEEALHAEVDVVLGGRAADWSDVPKLPVTDRVLTEAMRIYPPVWLLTRQTSRDTVLGGCPLPKGTVIVFSPYVLHHNKACYSDPETFDPDRWLAAESGKRPRGAFIPFAAGARKCVGNDFAMMEATMALASISSQWRLEEIRQAPVHPVPRAILRPNSLHMRLRRRH